MQDSTYDWTKLGEQVILYRSQRCSFISVFHWDGCGFLLHLVDGCSAARLCVCVSPWKQHVYLTGRWFCAWDILTDCGLGCCCA